MKILFASSEAFPFAVSGGLGDVAYALPKALSKKKIGVKVVMPLYGKISQEHRKNMRFITSIFVPVAWRNQYCGIFELDYEGVTYVFLDNEYYFKRDGMYGYYDDAERFSFFARAVIECIPHINFKPDVIHCNDWQTALTPVYYKLMYYNRMGFNNIKTILTIHNIQYQGRYGMDIMEDVLGIPEWAAPIIDNGGDSNMLKAGIECADKVTTVSPTYAKEILDPWFSYNLDGILRNKAYKLSGIVNGIDTDVYNPETDKFLPFNFTTRSLAGKKKCKAALQKELYLPEEPDVPVIAMVTRLAGHKGLDLVRYIFDDLMRCKIQFILLGSGEEEYEMFFHEKSQQYKDKFAFRCGFIPELAHKIYAGADMFLMPSKQEPCGLAQMVSLRYGTVPIVRQTGGLADTITDAGDEGVGYTFKSYNAHDMRGAIDRALGLYENKKEWRKLVMRGIKTDNSWSNSADKYIALYNDTIHLF